MARVKTEDLPETIKRSSKKAQETYRKALASAHEQYDSEERAHRTALAALNSLLNRALVSPTTYHALDASPAFAAHVPPRAPGDAASVFRGCGGCSSSRGSRGSTATRAR